MTLDLAARVSAGNRFPDRALCEPAGVVLLSAEDGLADTIRPRLDAAGADVSRVLSLATVPDKNGQERLLSIPEDIPLIEKGIERVGARLVVVDPLMAFLSADTNSHRDQDVRRALAPLAGLAERTGACVLVVRHLNKTPGNNPLYRGGGSIGIIGAARMGYLIAKDPQDEKRRVLASTKNNLAKPPMSLKFTLEEAEGGTVRINWLGESEVSARELLATPQDHEQSDARSEAAEFLQDVLSEGPLPAKEVFQGAEDARIADKTLRRAKNLLGVVAYRENSAGEQRGSGRWMWKLPVVDLSTEEDQGGPPAVQDGHASQAESGGHLEHDGGTGTRESRTDKADFQNRHSDLQDGQDVQDGQDGQRLESGSLEQEEPEILREPTGTPQLYSDDWEEI
jgi:AAA domain